MSPFHTFRQLLAGGLALLAPLAATAQFRGGSDDGTQVGQSSNQLLGRSIFLGGPDDGTNVGQVATQMLGRSIFLGGSNDGTDVGLAAGQPAGRSIFLGGPDDGSSTGLATSQLLGRSIFLGGPDDGTSARQVATQQLGRAFSLGGSDDGWAIALKSGTTTPLPVTLTDFGGRWQQHDALLFWKTASEVNTSHFELERSLDGQAFTTIQSLPAAGQSTSAKSYHYTDVNIGQLLPPGVTTLYYRLRSVDIGGAATYSGVVVLQATRSETTSGSEAEYAVFPNPAHDVVTITATPLPAGGAATIRLLDASGRVLLQQPLTSNRQQLSVSAFATGLYFLQLLAAEKVVYTQRLLISK